MDWKITNISLNYNSPSTINGIHNSYIINNNTTTADLTIAFDNFEIPEGSDLVSAFEDQMKNKNFIFEGNKFTREDVLKALQEFYPERFI